MKQSPCAWFENFIKLAHDKVYLQSQVDHTMFHKNVGGKVTMPIVYVDDIIMAGNTLAEIRNLQDSCAKEFEIKNLRDLRYFLGIEAVRSNKGIFLS